MSRPAPEAPRGAVPRAPRITLVVAMDDSGVIGRGGGLPWRLPNDLKFFKRITMGKPILMGRRTHESIGRPLPGRDNLVLTRDPTYAAEGCRVVHDLDEALAAAEGAGELMVIGGAEVYKRCLPLADRIWLTRVHGRFEGDTHMPALDPADWHETWRETHPADDKNPYPHSFVLLERCNGANEGD